MPLHDHFHPPWSVRRPWEGFHGAWATAIAFHLNSGVLPGDYFAMPLVQVGGRVEVDVGTFHEPEEAGASGETGAAAWAPPRPTLTIPLEAAGTDAFEVQVLRNLGGPQLRAAIALAGHLRRGVSVILIDIVTERLANLHAEILHALDRAEESAWESPTHLYAVSYRGVLEADPPRLEAWPEVLAVGSPLPVLPLWLEIDLGVPLPLEESYAVTRGSLRMRG
jgi:hypothetical protein